MNTRDNLFARLERLNEIGASLSSEKNIGQLLEKIVLAAKDITQADGGTLYLVSEDRRLLNFEIVRTTSLGIAFGGSAAPTSGVFSSLALYGEDGSPNNSMIAACAALGAQTINIPDAYEAEAFDFSGTRAFDARTGYRSRSFLAVPMKDHENEVIGVLQLINAISPESGRVVAFSDADQRLAESLASQAAIALTNRRLIQQLENLFEATVKMINTAIKDKSPYTNGHCERVPELATMLADAVAEENGKSSAGFQLSEADRYELRIAALMHDCGKITTPVHVVDKATKLETIFDRIHLVDVRFEIVRRDAEIRMIKAIAQGQREAEARAGFERFLEASIADQALLHRSNKGSERMGEADIARIREIAGKYSWLDAAGRRQPLLSDNEIENLCIVAGTLTGPEREIINNHIVATINMLEQLPWPRHLRHVPEYAGGHHERMDGKGYPRGLRGDQLSVQARILAIADIFEALTASDRPYKNPMKVSQALAILENFKNNGHLDPGLHEIFVRREVYRRYAEHFLQPEQIDC